MSAGECDRFRWFGLSLLVDNIAKLYLTNPAKVSSLWTTHQMTRAENNIEENQKSLFMNSIFDPLSHGAHFAL